MPCKSPPTPGTNPVLNTIPALEWMPDEVVLRFNKQKEIHFGTDGSSTKNGKGGAGIYMPANYPKGRPAKNINATFDGAQDINIAEFIPIREIIKGLSETIAPGRRTCRIFTDSQVNLGLLQNHLDYPHSVINTRMEGSLEEIYDLAQQKRRAGWQISIHKIAAHAGHSYNEMADTNARIASGIYPDAETANPGLNTTARSYARAGETPGRWSITLPQLNNDYKYPRDEVYHENTLDSPTSTNIKRDIKQYIYKYNIMWYPEERAIDKWAMKYGPGDYQLDPTVTRLSRSQMSLKHYKQVSKARYNVWCSNSTPYLQGKLGLWKMNDQCPICPAPNKALDNWYHRQNCTHPAARAARTKMHDEAVGIFTQKFKNSQGGRHRILTDTDGMRAFDNPRPMDWTKEASNIDHNPDTLGIEDTDSDSDSDNEVAIDKERQKIYTYSTYINENIDSEPDSDSDSDGADLTTEETPNEPIGTSRRCADSTRRRPFSFRMEFPPEQINEADPYKRHYKLEGSRHFFKPDEIALGSQGGEYALHSLSTDTTSHAIWALFTMLRPNIDKTQAKENPLPDPTPGIPEDHRLGEENHEIKWRYIRKSPSRTIPTEIDPDADLNPDIVIFKGLNEDQQFPTKPTRDFTIQIADVLTGREGEQGSTEESMEAAAQSKIRKYSAYLQRLSRMGWKVDKTVHIIALGIRGGIPNITTKSTIKLGLKKPVAERLSTKLSTTTATRLGRNLTLSRTLENLPEHSHRSACAQQVWKKFPKADTKGKNPIRRDPG